MTYPCITKPSFYAKTQGKREKLVVIAVCNKLLKQAFAIVKNGLPYNEDYKSKLA